MSKRAEERALELFPVDMQMCIDSTGEPYEVDVNAQRRKYVAFGYERAEKDLALTWEDIRSIIELYERRKAEDAAFDACDYEALLYEFNEQRKK